MRPRRLAPSGTPLGLPFRPVPPVVCAGLSGRLLVAARDESRGQVMLAALRDSGQIVDCRALSLSFATALIAAPNKAHLVGSRDSGFVDVTLGEDGSAGGETPLPVDSDCRLPPRWVCSGDALHGFWIDGRNQLVIARGTRTSRYPISPVVLDAACAAAPDGLLLLLSTGIPGRLEILRWTGDRLGTATALEGSEQSYCPLLHRVGDRYVALWVSRPHRAIVAQWVGPDGTPLGPARRIVSVSAPKTFVWLRGFVSGADRFALAWQTEQPGTELARDGTPIPNVDSFVALLDPVDLALGSSTPVPQRADSFFAGGWVGDRLVAVHGGAGAVSVFALADDVTAQGQTAVS
jgi:hypothetical protein